MAGPRVGETTHPGPSDPKRTMKKKNDKTPSAIDKTNTSRKCGQGDTDIDMINKAEKGHRSKGALLLETIGRDTAKGLKTHRRNIDIFWNDSLNNKPPAKRTLQAQKKKLIESI